jgi:hypothetical protein
MIVDGIGGQTLHSELDLDLSELDMDLQSEGPGLPLQTLADLRHAKYLWKSCSFISIRRSGVGAPLFL